jgi:hypothetical protein
LKRSGYAEKSPLKGLFASPFSGLPGLLHSCLVSTGGECTRNYAPVPDSAILGETNRTLKALDREGARYDFTIIYTSSLHLFTFGGIIPTKQGGEYVIFAPCRARLEQPDITAQPQS